MAGADAAAQFFSYIFPTFHDPEGLEFTLQFLGEVSCAVPISELSVVLDNRMIEFIRQAQAIQPTLQ